MKGLSPSTGMFINEAQPEITRSESKSSTERRAKVPELFFSEKKKT